MTTSAPATRQLPLGDVAELRIGRTPARANKIYWADGVHPWVSIADMKNAQLDSTKEKISSAALDACFGGQLAPAGTLLLSFKLSIGKVALLAVPAAHNEAIVGIYPVDELADSEYLFYCLQHVDLTHERDTYLKGKTLNKAKLERTLIPLPALDEQRRIAQALSTIERARDASRAAADAAMGLRSAVLANALLDGQRANWPVVALGDIASVERGRFTHRPRNDPAFYGGPTPFIQTGDVTRGALEGGMIRSFSQSLNAYGVSVSRIFQQGTIAITIAANIGFTAMLTFDSAFPDSIIGITPSDTVDGLYLNYYLATQQVEMDRLAPRGTQKNINIEFLKPWPVLLPPLDEQQRLAGAVQSIDRTVTADRAVTGRLTQVFRSALATLVGEHA